MEKMKIVLIMPDGREKQFVGDDIDELLKNVKSMYRLRMTYGKKYAK